LDNLQCNEEDIIEELGLSLLNNGNPCYDMYFCNGMIVLENSGMPFDNITLIN
jgi:hypothetical protein